MVAGEEMKKLALDVDGVLANFVYGANAEGRKQKLSLPDDWSCYETLCHYPGLWESFKYRGSFWLDLPQLCKNPGFVVDSYVTCRPIEAEITKFWLWKCGFAEAPVINVVQHEDKADVLLRRGVDLFVEDNHETWKHITAAGIRCFLLDALYNRAWDVGDDRLYRLDTLPFWVSGVEMV